MIFLQWELKYGCVIYQLSEDYSKAKLVFNRNKNDIYIPTGNYVTSNLTREDIARGLWASGETINILTKNEVDDLIFIESI